MEDLIKEYSNGEITVTWQPSKCIYSEICVKLLPKVYRPASRPWIKVNEATSKELMEQIDQCPSAALGYRKNS